MPRLPILAAIALMLASASAEEETTDGWDGTLELSAAASSGNTDNTVLGARFSARRVFGGVTHDIKSGANYTEVRTRNDAGETQKRTTQDRWFAEYRLEVQTGEATFLFVRGRAEQDRFSGFDNRVFVGGGLGHEIASGDRLDWSILAGPGVQYTELEDPETAAVKRVKDGYMLSAFAGSDLTFAMRENVDLEHELDVTWSEKNTTLSSVASIKTKVTETLSSRLSYEVNHETSPPEGREPTDTLLRASVVYGF
jgi:putative salt-induced outer membrane protein